MVAPLATLNNPELLPESAYRNPDATLTVPELLSATSLKPDEPPGRVLVLVSVPALLNTFPLEPNPQKNPTSDRKVNEPLFWKVAPLAIWMLEVPAMVAVPSLVSTPPLRRLFAPLEIVMIAPGATVRWPATS